LSVQPIENPVATIMRLIENRIRVIKDNVAVALVKVTEEDYDRELLKDYDAQVTVGLDPTRGVEDQKLNLAGTLRRRVVWLKVVGCAMNRADTSADTGQVMRDKLTEQIDAIIRENRSNPYTTTYNFYSLGYPSGYPHVAKDASGAAADLVPTSASWAELSAANYQKIWSNDDIFHSKSNAAVGGYSLMLFKFKIGAYEPSVKSIVLTFTGYGTAPGGDGAIIKVWDHVSSSWGNAQSGTAGAKETLTITLTSAWTNYIDADGFLYLLAETTNPTGGSAAVLYCDFVQCVTQVKGLTNCDVVIYKTSTEKAVKPYVFKTEFQLKGWLIENIP